MPSRIKTVLTNFPEALFFVFLISFLTIFNEKLKLVISFEIFRFNALFSFPSTLLFTGIRLRYFENSKPYYIASLITILSLSLITFFNSVCLNFINYLFFINGILLISISFPFLKDFGKKEDMFSLFTNKILLTSLTAFLLGGVLFVSTAGLFLGVHSLFDLSLFSHLFEVGVISLYFYPMIFILSSLKQDLSAKFVLPKAISYFFNFLIPYLVLSYGLVIYVYFFKIVWEFELPRGTISYLGFSYAIAGIIFHFFASPFVSEASPFIRKYHKRFYWTLIIPLFMVAIALFRRLLDYGLTESRYYAILCATILAGTALTALFSKSFSYRKTFIYVGIVLILTAYGPLSAGYLSKYFHQPENFFKELSK